MSSDQAVYEAISAGTGTPGARQTWGPAACEPPLPFFTYERRDGGVTTRDDQGRAIPPRYRVTLYALDGDHWTQDAFTHAVGRLGPYRRSWERDERRGACVTRYDFTLTGGVTE